MKNRIRNWTAVVLLTFGVSLPAHASPTCLAPEPACALVLLGAAVTAIVHETNEQEVRDLEAGPKPAPPRGRVDRIEHADDGRQATRARDPARDRAVGVPR